MKSTNSFLALLFFGSLFATATVAQEELTLPKPPTPSTASSSTSPKPKPKPPEFPTEEKITEGYTKVVSTLEPRTFYTIWRRNKDQQLLAALPKGYEKEKHYIALTIASGDSYAGLQAGEKYVYWKRYGKRMALIEPNLTIRSSGDNESKSSVKRLFTDKVLLDVPILGMSKSGGPIIDLDALLVGEAGTFFGYQGRGLQRNLLTIKTAKAFPENIEVGIEVPNSYGRLQTYHYSISLIKPNKAYKARVADERIGYFVTDYRDFGKFKQDETIVRYINRWHLEKADKNLRLSPPKEPIVFYIEHTTPIRYRRWVREGILMWNKAFEKVGLLNAIEVRQQDAATKAHMEKDPEDVRYNFVRWLSNGIGTAIGPSRVDPNTGQILDADIILTDGWIRHFWNEYHEVILDVTMEGFSPEDLAWMHQNPKWDPRVRLAAPEKREEIIASRAANPMPSLGGHALGKIDSQLLGDQEFDGLGGGYSQKNGLCMASNCKSHGLAMKHMMMAIQAHEMAAPKKGGADALGGKKQSKKDEGKDDEAKTEDDDDEGNSDKDEKKDDADKDEKTDEKDGSKKPTTPDTKSTKYDKETEEQLLDGVPETFIGPLLADLVAHEVGHTIGLRHNFKASSVYTVEETNSKELAGKKAFAGSVMDYLPVNFNVETGEVQGDYAMIDVGPYDLWAIEYGYTFETDLKPILARAAEPELAYATDEDTWGTDPLARRYDFGKEPLTYAENQMRLVRKNRAGIVDKFVKDGESWAKARRGYLLTLYEQAGALSMMANWVGGTHVYRDRKGDPNGRAPIEVVSLEQQRKALAFVIENSFDETAFGLTPDLLKYMTLDMWWDQLSWSSSPAWNIHDRVLGIQSSLLSNLMRPSKLEQIYDNEFRVPADEDAFTIPELLDQLGDGIWGDLKQAAKVNGGKFTNRKPMISSFRRNLQAEYIDRLIDLADPESGLSIGERPIQDLAAMELRDIQKSVAGVIKEKNLDSYSRAHLLETQKRITKALNADFVVPFGR